MIGWILGRRDPTIVNGAEMKNFISPDYAVCRRPIGDGRTSSAKSTRATVRSRLCTAHRGAEQHLSLDHKPMAELSEFASATLSARQAGGAESR